MKTNVDNALIVNLSSDTNAYNEGLELFLNDKITDVLEEKMTTGFRVRFSVNADEVFKVTIRCDHSGRVKGYGCTCLVSDAGNGACVHTVSALFYLADLNNLEGSQVKTDFISKEMIADFKKKFQTSLFSSDDDNKDMLVSLVPNINFNVSNRLYLTFKVSTNNKAYYERNTYIIKNVSEFVKNVEESLYFSYGKDLSFVHNINKFDKKSRALIELIISEKANLEDASNNILKSNKEAKVNNFSTNKELYLSRDGIDKFFNLYLDEEVFEYKITEEIPNIKFFTKVQNTSLSFYKSNVKYFVLSGNKFGYLLIENNIYKIPIELSSILKFFNKSFDKTKNEFIKFKGEDVYDFLSFILPLMKQYNLIDREYITEFYELGYIPLTSKVYLDTEDGVITAKVVFCYGNDEIVFLKPTDYDSYRDKLQEEEIIKTLMHFGFLIDKDELKLKADDDIFDFYNEGIDALTKKCEIFVTDKFTKKQYKKEKSKTFTKVTIVGDLLEVTIENDMYTTDELIEALNNYKTKKTYFRLKNGKFINMKDENILNTLKMMNILGAKDDEGKFITTKNKAFFLSDFLSSTEFDVVKDASFTDLLEKINTIKNEKAYLNDFLKKTLRSYQKEGLNWLKGLVDLGFGAVLADEMGLGKTLEIIALIESNRMTETEPYIIVCPSSLVYNWKNEFCKFASDRDVELIIGNPNEREEIIKNIKKGTVYITTYDMMKRDVDLYNNILFEFVILDEAQYIKNPVTLGAKAVKMLRKKTAIALTGTPIENSLKELWSIFDFIMPNYLGDLNTFHNTFTLPIMVDNDTTKTSMLKRQIQPFILRRFKKDVLKELPKKIETVFYAEMTKEQRLCYDAFFKEAKGEIYETNSSINIISKLTRLRQISCHPSLFIENYQGGSGKQDSAMEIIKSSISEGHRILFFSQFTSMLDIIKKSLEEEGIGYFYLDGKTKSQDREKYCARFNAGENEIFLISLKAGGTGLNLTGADIVIHYDPWWNPSVMNQASDRAHRFGQKQVVQVINIITKDTIEEKIFKLQEKKKELIDNVLTDDVQFINKLSKEELLDLFS